MAEHDPHRALRVRAFAHNYAGRRVLWHGRGNHQVVTVVGYRSAAGILEHAGLVPVLIVAVAPLTKNSWGPSQVGGRDHVLAPPGGDPHYRYALLEELSVEVL